MTRRTPGRRRVEAALAVGSEDALLGIQASTIDLRIQSATATASGAARRRPRARAVVHLDARLVRAVVLGGAVVLVGRAAEGTAAEDEVDEGLQDGDAAGDDDGAGFDAGTSQLYTHVYIYIYRDFFWVLTLSKQRGPRYQLPIVSTRVFGNTPMEGKWAEGVILTRKVVAGQRWQTRTLVNGDNGGTAKLLSVRVLLKWAPKHRRNIP